MSCRDSAVLKAQEVKKKEQISTYIRIPNLQASADEMRDKYYVICIKYGPESNLGLSPCVIHNLEV